MTTTEKWYEAQESGDAYVHVSGRWALVRVNAPAPVFFLNGWRLFGPGTEGRRVDIGPRDASPALDLLLASRTADALIAAFEERREVR